MWYIIPKERTDELYHHGIKGQKWGVRNGPPYPLDHNGDRRRKISAISGGAAFGSENASDDLPDTQRQTVKSLLDTAIRVNGVKGADGSIKAGRKAFLKLPKERQSNCAMCTIAGLSSYYGKSVNAKADWPKDDPGQKALGYSGKSLAVTKMLFRQIIPGCDKTEAAVASVADVTHYIKEQKEGSTGAIFLPLEMHGFNMAGAHWVQWSNVGGKAFISDNQSGICCPADTYFKETGRTLKPYVRGNEAYRGSIFTITEDMIQNASTLGDYTE